MDGIDSKILVITRNKNKIKPIRRILADSGNFELVYSEQDGKYYKVNSLTTEKTYKVSRTDMGGFFCDCIYNQKYIPYKVGMKKHGKKPECIHILALKCWLAITKDY